MYKPFVSIKYPIFGAHVFDTELQCSDLVWKEPDGIMASLVHTLLIKTHQYLSTERCGRVRQKVGTCRPTCTYVFFYPKGLPRCFVFISLLKDCVFAQVSIRRTKQKRLTRLYMSQPLIVLLQRVGDIISLREDHGFQ